MNPASQPNFYTTFRQAVSPERLTPFRLLGDDNAEVIARYFWSVALNEALYPPLQLVEVALRNALHSAIAQDLHNPNWIYSSASILRPPEQAIVSATVAEMLRESMSLTPNSIIPRLSFGFWTSLLNTRYDAVLWPRLLRATFPHMPRRTRTRPAVSARLNRIRRLRNRVFHHEPVWQWPDLARQHAALIDAIGWVSPAAKASLLQFGRFSTVHDRGMADFVAGAMHLLDQQT